MSWFFGSPVPAPPPKDSPARTPFSLPDIPRSTSPDREPLGTLVVVVLKARHLLTASSSRWTKQSPYVCLTLYTTHPPTITSVGSIPTSSDTAGHAILRKRSRDGSRERRTSFASVPPLERAAAVDKARAKLEKERAKTMSQTTLVSTPEDEPLEFEPEEEFDHRAALCTPADPRGGQHPIWDAELRFPMPIVAAEGRRTINVEAWAKVGLGRKDKPLGSARLDVEEAISKGAMDAWLPLSLNGVERGEVFLNLTFFTAQPSQLVPHPSSAPPLSQPAVPSALNSLLWRHGIPLRIPRISLRFLVRKDAMPDWVRPKAVLTSNAWTSVVGGFKQIFMWTFAAKD